MVQEVVPDEEEELALQEQQKLEELAKIEAEYEAQLKEQEALVAE